MFSDVSIVVEGCQGYVITKHGLCFLGVYKTPELVVKSLCDFAPPSSTTHAFVLFNDIGLDIHRQTVEALQKAGYPNIESVDRVSFDMASNIFNLPLNCDIGEEIFVATKLKGNTSMKYNTYYILKKCKAGWRITGDKVNTMFAVYLRATSNVVISDTIPVAERIEMTQSLPGRKVHLSKTPDSNFMATYFRNRVSKGNLNGYDVLPYFNINLRVRFGIKSEVVNLHSLVVEKGLPLTITKSVDVRNAPGVAVEAFCPGLESQFPVTLNAMRFDGGAFRAIQVTVAVDNTLVPQAKVTFPDENNTDSHPNADSSLPSQNDVPTNGTKKAKKKRRKKENQVQTVVQDVSAELTPLFDSDLAKAIVADDDDKEPLASAHLQNEMAITCGLNAETQTDFETCDVSLQVDLPNAKNDEAIVESDVKLSKEPSQLKLDPVPTTILTFTSDNRVLIEADKTYNGDQFILAYVRLQKGMPPQVGREAFDYLRRHPDSVFYDITRLLATDFDPDYPHPLWDFKTSRDSDGRISVYANGITTYPIVLFGLVVQSTLLYIQGHMTSDVTAVGIRLPAGSVICDSDLKDVSTQIGVKLVLLE